MSHHLLAHDLQKACQILFNTDIRQATDFFSSLDESVLRNAYRKKAFETHPDRSRALGKSEAQMIKKFKEVTIAYEILKPMVEGDKNIHIVNIRAENEPQPKKQAKPPREPQKPPFQKQKNEGRDHTKK